ncbi:myrosinase 1-like isoform X2 [Cylas formicarius]|uniref:myrosinase 1-like isoform X2 n=1 Tax=Cylas formicarius TaxID=197179 RepID=UPI00295879A6|nr:myrosinase 1-like isoform X2 [Cylas formicarius]
MCRGLLIFCLANWAISGAEIEIKAQEKSTFPDGFLFGVATSAYQIEGSQNAKGAGETVWDRYRETDPQLFHNSSLGDRSFCDSVNKWRDDVNLLSDLGVSFYRFSIAWSRILPDGLANNVNQEGVKYYNSLIDELIAKGIRPVVTMYHYDLPMVLQNLGGWTNPYMVYYFEDYARILFTHFGDRVKHWITMNAACPGYGDEDFPPFMKDPPVAKYFCVHVTLLAHAKAYHLYDNEFRLKQKDGRWYEPRGFQKVNREAAERTRDFQVGMFLHPIFHPDGNYPARVMERIEKTNKQEGYMRSKLPQFSSEEVAYVQGTYDFLGLNLYTTYLVEDFNRSTEKPSYDKDLGVKISQDEKWSGSASHWLKVYPEGARKMLKWIKDTYDDFPIIISENGFSDRGELADVDRIKYLQGYLSAILEAVYEDSVDVEAYTVWSLFDNFEWVAGFSEKFGLYHVNFTDPSRKRTPKLSADWYKRVIKERRIVEVPV